MYKNSLMLVASMALFACNNSDTAETKAWSKNDSIKKDSAENNKTNAAHVLKKYNQLTDEPGVIGIFEVPEMLTLCRKDSANAANMAEAFAKNYTLLEKDLTFLNIKSQGAAGSIYYNNDTSNFIFECVYPISEMPKKTPKKSTVVVLEASPMLVYNHYGEYMDLHFAYDNIRKYLRENKLVQAGPLREFYISNPVIVKDHSKWLTRIMLPVMNKKISQ